MRWTARIVATAGVAMFAVACDQSSPTTPTMSAGSASFSKSGASCEIDIGTTTHPLFALHELADWLSAALNNAGSSVNCGGTQSLAAKLAVITKSLDDTPPNWAAACGASGALVNELNALVNRGQLATPSFPPPFPGGPSNVLAAAIDLNQHWCDAARGVLTGPRS